MFRRMRAVDQRTVIVGNFILVSVLSHVHRSELPVGPLGQVFSFPGRFLGIVGLPYLTVGVTLAVSVGCIVGTGIDENSGICTSPSSPSSPGP